MRKAYDDADGVAGGEREDVGAGHDAGALLLEQRLDAVDEAEAPQRLVGRRVLLRLLAARRVEQHRRVAALHSSRGSITACHGAESVIVGIGIRRRAGSRQAGRWHAS